jgi:hypothetical protein
LPWSNANHFPKHPVHTVRTNSCALGKIREFQCPLRILPDLLFDFAAQLRHRTSIFALRGISVARWFAAEARAKSSLFRNFGLAKKCDLIAPRPARRA